MEKASWREFVGRQNPINVKALLKDVFFFYRTHFWVCVAAGFLWDFGVWQAFFSARAYAPDAVYAWQHLTVLVLGMPLFYLYLGSCYRGEPINPPALLKRAAFRVLPYVGMSLKFGLYFMLGALCLLLPGIYAYGLFFLAPVVAVLEENPKTDAFNMSRMLIKGSFREIVLMGLIYNIVSTVLVQGVSALMASQAPLFFKIPVALPLFLNTLLTGFWFCLHVVLFYKMRERLSSQVRMGLLALRFDGRFKDAKGESRMWHFKASDESVLRGHLDSIGWQIEKLHNVQYVPVFEPPPAKT